MSRIEECPRCGSWSGPASGEAASVVRVICEECKASLCVRCGSPEVYNDNVDNPLCLGCFLVARDAVYESLKESANG